MCPLWPLHIILLYLLALSPLWLFMANATAIKPLLRSSTVWNASYNPPSMSALVQGTYQEIIISSPSHEIGKAGADGTIELCSSHPEIASIAQQTIYLNSTRYSDTVGGWSDAFNLTGNFLGHTEIKAQLKNGNGGVVGESPAMPVSVVRPVRTIDLVFTYSVVTLVSIIFINMGCALDWEVIKQVMKRPVGPIVGFVSQFLFMPVVSFGLAQLLFPGMTGIQLGMFVTGCSPGGGASNIWTLMLGGNLNLSIAMTTLSTILAFGMIPVWMFTLGQVIFKSRNIVVPYSKIATFAFALVVPLGIGLLVQKFLPKVSKLMVRILKPFAAFLILFIIVFAVYTNLYLFRLFSWQIVVAGLGLPWLGYMFGAVLSKVSHLSWEDLIAVAVETGVQNTGLSIFMLKFTLGQPEADLATVVPVSVAIMTPIPLMVLLGLQRLGKWKQKRKEDELGYTLAFDGAPNHITYVQ